jgi:hypothetical protein
MSFGNVGNTATHTIMMASTAPSTRTTVKDIPLWLTLVDDAFEGGMLACLAITEALNPLDPKVCTEQ